VEGIKMYLTPIDFVFVMIGLCGLWGLAEIHNMLKQIFYELNPRKRPLKASKRKRPFRVFKG
jgi:hypothetical protein